MLKPWTFRYCYYTAMWLPQLPYTQETGSQTCKHGLQWLQICVSTRTCVIVVCTTRKGASFIFAFSTWINWLSLQGKLKYTFFNFPNSPLERILKVERSNPIIYLFFLFPCHIKLRWKEAYEPTMPFLRIRYISCTSLSGGGILPGSFYTFEPRCFLLSFPRHLNL